MMTTHTPTSTAQILRHGAAIGLAGGLAEILVIGAYAESGGIVGQTVARAISAAVRLDADSALIGVSVHLLLAVALGIGLMFVADRTGVQRHRSAGFTFAMSMATLAAVWAINFFVVLPVLSPSFVHLLPYAVSLFSKLMFGAAAASTLLVIARRDGLPTSMPALRSSAFSSGR